MLLAQTETLRVGNIVPGFELPTSTHSSFSSEDLTGRWGVISFFRGTW